MINCEIHHADNLFFFSSELSEGKDYVLFVFLNLQQLAQS